MGAFPFQLSGVMKHRYDLLHPRRGVQHAPSRLKRAKEKDRRIISGEGPQSPLPKTKSTRPHQSCKYSTHRTATGVSQYPPSPKWKSLVLETKSRAFFDLVAPCTDVGLFIPNFGHDFSTNC